MTHLPQRPLLPRRPETNQVLATAEVHKQDLTSTVLHGAVPPRARPWVLPGGWPGVSAGLSSAGPPGDLGLSGLAGALRPLFPEWAAGLPAAPEPAEDATAARHRLFRALAEVLDRLQVAMLVAEDAHWTAGRFPPLPAPRSR